MTSTEPSCSSLLSCLKQEETEKVSVPPISASLPLNFITSVSAKENKAEPLHHLVARLNPSSAFLSSKGRKCLVRTQKKEAPRRSAKCVTKPPRLCISHDVVTSSSSLFPFHQEESKRQPESSPERVALQPPLRSIVVDPFRQVMSVSPLDIHQRFLVRQLLYSECATKRVKKDSRKGIPLQRAPLEKQDHRLCGIPTVLQCSSLDGAPRVEVVHPKTQWPRPQTVALSLPSSSDSTVTPPFPTALSSVLPTTPSVPHKTSSPSSLLCSTPCPPLEDYLWPYEDHLVVIPINSEFVLTSSCHRGRSGEAGGPPAGTGKECCKEGKRMEVHLRSTSATGAIYHPPDPLSKQKSRCKDEDNACVGSSMSLTAGVSTSPLFTQSVDSSIQASASPPRVEPQVRTVGLGISITRVSENPWRGEGQRTAVTPPPTNQNDNKETKENNQISGFKNQPHEGNEDETRTKGMNEEKEVNREQELHDCEEASSREKNSIDATPTVGRGSTVPSVHVINPPSPFSELSTLPTTDPIQASDVVSFPDLPFPSITGWVRDYSSFSMERIASCLQKLIPASNLLFPPMPPSPFSTLGTEADYCTFSSSPIATPSADLDRTATKDEDPNPSCSGKMLALVSAPTSIPPLTSHAPEGEGVEEEGKEDEEKESRQETSPEEEPKEEANPPQDVHDDAEGQDEGHVEKKEEHEEYKDEISLVVGAPPEHEEAEVVECRGEKVNIEGKKNEKRNNESKDRVESENMFLRAQYALPHRFLITDAERTHSIWAMEVVLGSNAFTHEHVEKITNLPRKEIPTGGPSSSRHSWGKEVQEEGTNPMDSPPTQDKDNHSLEEGTDLRSRPPRVFPSLPHSHQIHVLGHIEYFQRSHKPLGSSGSAAPAGAVSSPFPPTPLIGTGVKGYRDGCFEYAQFHTPVALCWRGVEGKEGTRAPIENEDERQGEKRKKESGKGGAWQNSKCTSSAALDGADFDLNSSEPSNSLPLSASAEGIHPFHKKYVLSPTRVSPHQLFISDAGNHAIRLADFSTQMVRTLVGGGSGGSSPFFPLLRQPGYRDGIASHALLYAATGMIYGSSGLLFTDGPNGAVRLLTGILPDHLCSFPDEMNDASVGMQKTSVSMCRGDPLHVVSHHHKKEKKRKELRVDDAVPLEEETGRENNEEVDNLLQVLRNTVASISDKSTIPDDENSSLAAEFTPIFSSFCLGSDDPERVGKDKDVKQDMEWESNDHPTQDKRKIKNSKTDERTGKEDEGEEWRAVCRLYELVQDRFHGDAEGMERDVPPYKGSSPLLQERHERTQKDRKDVSFSSASCDSADFSSEASCFPSRAKAFSLLEKEKNILSSLYVWTVAGGGGGDGRCHKSQEKSSNASSAALFYKDSPRAGSANCARFGYLTDLALVPESSNGSLLSLYMCDATNNSIRVLTEEGTVHTLVGSMDFQEESAGDEESREGEKEGDTPLKQYSNEKGTGGEGDRPCLPLASLPSSLPHVFTSLPRPFLPFTAVGHSNPHEKSVSMFISSCGSPATPFSSLTSSRKENGKKKRRKCGTRSIKAVDTPLHLVPLALIRREWCGAGVPPSLPDGMRSTASTHVTENAVDYRPRRYSSSMTTWRQMYENSKKSWPTPAILYSTSMVFIVVNGSDPQQRRGGMSAHSTYPLVSPIFSGATQRDSFLHVQNEDDAEEDSVTLGAHLFLPVPEHFLDKIRQDALKWSSNEMQEARNRRLQGGIDTEDREDRQHESRFFPAPSPYSSYSIDVSASAVPLTPSQRRWEKCLMQHYLRLGPLVACNEDAALEEKKEKVVSERGGEKVNSRSASMSSSIPLILPTSSAVWQNVKPVSPTRWCSSFSIPRVLGEWSSSLSIVVSERDALEEEKRRLGWGRWKNKLLSPLQEEEQEEKYKKVNALQEDAKIEEREMERSEDMNVGSVELSHHVAPPLKEGQGKDGITWTSHGRSAVSTLYLEDRPHLRYWFPWVFPPVPAVPNLEGLLGTVHAHIGGEVGYPLMMRMRRRNTSTTAFSSLGYTSKEGTGNSCSSSSGSGGESSHKDIPDAPTSLFEMPTSLSSFSLYEKEGHGKKEGKRERRGTMAEKSRKQQVAFQKEGHPPMAPPYPSISHTTTTTTSCGVSFIAPLCPKIAVGQVGSLLSYLSAPAVWEGNLHPLTPDDTHSSYAHATQANRNMNTGQNSVREGAPPFSFLTLSERGRRDGGDVHLHPHPDEFLDSPSPLPTQPHSFDLNLSPSTHGPSVATATPPRFSSFEQGGAPSFMGEESNCTRTERMTAVGVEGGVLDLPPLPAVVPGEMDGEGTTEEKDVNAAVPEPLECQPKGLAPPAPSPDTFNKKISGEFLTRRDEGNEMVPIAREERKEEEVREEYEALLKAAKVLQSTLGEGGGGEEEEKGGGGGVTATLITSRVIPSLPTSLPSFSFLSTEKNTLFGRSEECEASPSFQDLHGPSPSASKHKIMNFAIYPSLEAYRLAVPSTVFPPPIPLLQRGDPRLHSHSIIPPSNTGYKERGEGGWEGSPTPYYTPSSFSSSSLSCFAKERRGSYFLPQKNMKNNEDEEENGYNERLEDALHRFYAIYQTFSSVIPMLQEKKKEKRTQKRKPHYPSFLLPDMQKQPLRVISPLPLGGRGSPPPSSSPSPTPAMTMLSMWYFLFCTQYLEAPTAVGEFLAEHIIRLYSHCYHSLCKNTRSPRRVEKMNVEEKAERSDNYSIHTFRKDVSLWIHQRTSFPRSVPSSPCGDGVGAPLLYRMDPRDAIPFLYRGFVHHDGYHVVDALGVESFAMLVVMLFLWEEKSFGWISKGKEETEKAMKRVAKARDRVETGRAPKGIPRVISARRGTSETAAGQPPPHSRQGKGRGSQKGGKSAPRVLQRCAACRETTSPFPSPSSPVGDNLVSDGGDVRWGDIRDIIEETSHHDGWCRWSDENTIEESKKQEDSVKMKVGPYSCGSKRRQRARRPGHPPLRTGKRKVKGSITCPKVPQCHHYKSSSGGHGDHGPIIAHFLSPNLSYLLHHRGAWRVLQSEIIEKEKQTLQKFIFHVVLPWRFTQRKRQPSSLLLPPPQSDENPIQKEMNKKRWEEDENKGVMAESDDSSHWFENVVWDLESRLCSHLPLVTGSSPDPDTRVSSSSPSSLSSCLPHVATTMSSEMANTFAEVTQVLKDIDPNNFTEKDPRTLLNKKREEVEEEGTTIKKKEENPTTCLHYSREGSTSSFVPSASNIDDGGMPTSIHRPTAHSQHEKEVHQLFHLLLLNEKALWRLFEAFASPLSPAEQRPPPYPSSSIPLMKKYGKSGAQSEGEEYKDHEEMEGDTALAGTRATHWDQQKSRWITEIEGANAFPAQPSSTPHMPSNFSSPLFGFLSSPQQQLLQWRWWKDVSDRLASVSRVNRPFCFLQGGKEREVKNSETEVWSSASPSAALFLMSWDQFRSLWKALDIYPRFVSFRELLVLFLESLHVPLLVSPLEGREQKYTRQERRRCWMRIRMAQEGREGDGFHCRNGREYGPSCGKEEDMENTEDWDDEEEEEEHGGNNDESEFFSSIVGRLKCGSTHAFSSRRMRKLSFIPFVESIVRMAQRVHGHHPPPPTPLAGVDGGVRSEAQEGGPSTPHPTTVPASAQVEQLFRILQKCVNYHKGSIPRPSRKDSRRPGGDGGLHRGETMVVHGITRGEAKSTADLHRERRGKVQEMTSVKPWPSYPSSSRLPAWILSTINSSSGNNAHKSSREKMLRLLQNWRSDFQYLPSSSFSSSKFSRVS